MAPSDINLILFAIAGGGLPTLLWLWFWLKEDKKKPEPKPLILATFLGGMVAVVVALFIEMRLIEALGFKNLFSMPAPALLQGFLILVFVEEAAKYAAAQGIAFPNRHFDEPLDAVIYMITAALGFAALENILFLLTHVGESALLVQEFTFSGTVAEVLVGNNLRFIGATVLHTVSSGFVGIFIGLSFYRPRTVKVLYLFCGLFIATLLHALFNFSIIIFNDTNPIIPFAAVWVVAIVMILLIEKVKRVAY